MTAPLNRYYVTITQTEERSTVIFAASEEQAIATAKGIDPRDMIFEQNATAVWYAEEVQL